MAVNNQNGIYAQVFQGTPYTFVYTKNLNGRTVEKYCFDNRVNQDVARAAQTIRNFLANHQNFCPTFTIQQGILEQEIPRNIYLTINGNAISLAGERAAPDGAPREAIDRYFSEALIQEPTCCPQSHYFERSRAQNWARQMQNICPAGGQPHQMGNLAIDDDLQNDIQGFLRNHQMQRNIIDRQQLMVIENTNLRIQQQRQQQEINVLGNQVAGSLWATAGTVSVAGGKTVVKLAMTKGGAKICAEIGKIAAQKLAVEGGKQAGKEVAKNIVKHLPIVSFCFGVVAACYRAYHGQWWRAGGELVSGAAGCIPGGGTAVSVAIDVSMASYDIYEIYHPEAIEAPPPLQIDLNAAYQAIGIDILHNPNPPSKAEVDHAYREQAALLHPDRAAELMAYNQEQLGAMMQALNLCRDQIYQARGWA